LSERAYGPLIILSGPSGSGKSTVLARLLARGDLPLRLSVSVTTRPPRPGESDGVHYYFWDKGHFEAELDAGGFLEWAQVFGNYYGTLRREVEPYRRAGTGVILDIDVRGAAQVRHKCPDAATVFLRTSSLAAYEERLRKRGTETEEAIRRRVAAARCELEHAGEYDYQVVNDDLEQAVADLHVIVRRLFGGKGEPCSTT
jgi:guanylate kinase